MLTADQFLSRQLLSTPLSTLFDSMSAHYSVDEDHYLRELLVFVDADDHHCDSLARRTTKVIEEIRSRDNAIDGIDKLLQQYSLSTQEGVLLMCLAEALLRVPDAHTADALIKDKLTSATWDRYLGQSDALLVNAATWGLVLTGRLVQLNESSGQPSGLIKRMIHRVGEPVIRTAMGQAMKLMGHQFVLGRTIDEALKRSKLQFQAGNTYSYDMLGEAAHTMADADRYFNDYRNAIEAVGRKRADLAGKAPAPSISIKLSALHPRYERSQQQRVLSELVGRVRQLVDHAREHQVALTIDAEEADRLEISLEVFQAVYQSDSARGWGEFGLVVQAYAKRALPELHWLTRLAAEQRDRIPVRLVKGAYWDTEIKHCQQLGTDGYPVFTRKPATDLSFLACAKYLLSDLAEGRLFPQFATHNAHTLVSLQAMAGNRPFECQRLHGMGEALYNVLIAKAPQGSYCRIYAPVGAHKDLLPYLVRRLLENGANSSFVHQLVDPRVPITSLCRHPAQLLRKLMDDGAPLANPYIPTPRHLYGPDRPNAKGVNLNVESQYHPLLEAINAFQTRSWSAAPLLAAPDTLPPGPRRQIYSPFDTSQQVGEVTDTSPEQTQAALDTASRAFPDWNATPVAQRAELLEKVAISLEDNMAELIALCGREAGKQLQDGIDEVREAVDFCRYYALQGRRLFGNVLPQDGPTGERNDLYLTGRGVFVAISPWNFPVAIFTGQVAAALMSGNPVLAKPAEQTTLVAHRVVELMHLAGIPRQVLQLLPGDGPGVGTWLTTDPRVSGVAFTGSTDTARRINLNLAGRERAPLATLIAETGGLNAMIVDSTALPEQVVTDVIQSAFTSAGQRCSALRVLYLQEEIADRVEIILKGAMAELKVGDPRQYSTDVGPVIDNDALTNLNQHVDRFVKEGKLLGQTRLEPEQTAHGHFVAPVALTLGSMAELDREPFGPILHIVRYRSSALEAVFDQINAAGYGLTLGVHSRNERFAEQVERRVRAGNTYVNRNIIGAVVGVQPFGGLGLSGTGPKAGGPHYLLRFATERTRTINTAALGGNAALLALGEN